MDGLLHLVQRGGDWAGLQPVQTPPRCSKCKNPPINGQCTKFVLFDVALELPLESKGLIVMFLRSKFVKRISNTCHTAL